MEAREKARSFETILQPAARINDKKMKEMPQNNMKGVMTLSLPHQLVLANL